MIKRDKYFLKLNNYLDTEFIKVITGVRRSGKSFLLKLLKEHLENESKQILYINFEALEYANLLSFEKLYEFIKNNVNKSEKVYFLFDEISEVENWQKLINDLRVSYNCDIYITGSNANLLSGELATYLTGRYVLINIYPLSFKEYLDFTKNDNKPNKLIDYITYGGFPLVALVADAQMKHDVLRGIYNSIILKDVSLRGNVANMNVLMKLSLYLLDNIGNTISTTKIANYFTSTGQKVAVDTISKYLDLLENSFVFYKARRYDIRGKAYLQTLVKYYVVDPGIKNVMIGKINDNLSSLIENIVYLKLLQDGYEVFVGKYNDLEIDFVCFKNQQVKYIQVTLSMPKKSKRETDNLLLIKDNFERVVVTYDYDNVGTTDGIRIIHLNDFLLE